MESLRTNFNMTSIIWNGLIRQLKCTRSLLLLYAIINGSVLVDLCGCFGICHGWTIWAVDEEEGRFGGHLTVGR